MHKGLFRTNFIAGLLVALMVAVPFAALLPNTATAATDPAAVDCQNYLASAPISELSNPGSKSSQCKTLIELFADLANQQAALTNQHGVSGNLSSDIKNLTAQITAKQTAIKVKVAHIAVLSVSIGEKQTAIVSLSTKIENEKESLAQLIRKTNEMDQTTLTNFVFSDKSLSDFYSDVSRFDALKTQVKASVDSIQTIKGVTEQNKAALEKEQNQTVDEQHSLAAAKNTLAQQQTTQKTLLSVSQTKEKAYQTVIAQQQAKVADIKSKLFSLAGGGQAIRFDIALQYANQAAAKTGIDPAFLLAELTQESNLGANVGKCYLTDTSTGAGVGVSSGKSFPNVMKPSRDVQPFIDITGALGYNWQKTVVSCPIAGVAGYGGAMGPAQFIASTWKLFIPRLTADLGHQPSPWAAQDAFMAASLYLTDLGGVGASASSQLRASCKYYGSGGATCSYGRNVQTLRLSIQSDIDYLNQYGVSRR
jgi:peptidoglycan hydrolase CwlO-like protein